MWKYVGKCTLRQVLLTAAAILAVCLLFYLLSGGWHWVFGE